MTDSVAVDAKRILLRYGAPIAILDKVSEVHRIEFAREIAMTRLPERQYRLRQLLAERGYMEAPVAPKGAKGKGKSKPAAAPNSEVVGKAKAAPATKSTAKAVESKSANSKSANSKSAKKKAAKAQPSKSKAPKPERAEPKAAKPEASKPKAAKRKAAKGKAAKPKAAKGKGRTKK